MYLLKFRPVCLIQYICTPFPSFPPAVHSHVYRNNKTWNHKFPHSLFPSTSISLSVYVSLFLSLFSLSISSVLHTQTNVFLSFCPILSHHLPFSYNISTQSFDFTSDKCLRLLTWLQPITADTSAVKSLNKLISSQ